MPEVKPFAALRPKPELAARICELPYDVVSAAEARALAQDNPLSFFHVSKPEIDLPLATDPYSAAVYERGRVNFAGLIQQGALVQDPKPQFYLYRQVMDGHHQTGLVGVASCRDYLAGKIKKHELTRIDKENDRVRHLEALDAQTGPAFLAYRAWPELDRFLASRMAAPPACDYTASDGVRHTAWTIGDPEAIRFIESAFARLPCLYIADGHHRTAAAGRVCEARQGRGGSGHFLAVIFPHDQLQILPYHRVVKDLNGHTPAALRERLAAVFETLPSPESLPAAKHEVGFYFEGRWRKLRFRAALTGNPDPIERLDVALLQRQVLDAIFGIADPRTSERIGFVGGIRGTPELERLVDGGDYACAFAMFPTGIEDLMAIADAGGIMPPKSTWFEPKLRDALFCHLIA